MNISRLYILILLVFIAASCSTSNTTNAPDRSGMGDPEKAAERIVAANDAIRIGEINDYRRLDPEHASKAEEALKEMEAAERMQNWNLVIIKANGVIANAETSIKPLRERAQAAIDSTESLYTKTKELAKDDADITKLLEAREGIDLAVRIYNEDKDFALVHHKLENVNSSLQALQLSGTREATKGTMQELEELLAKMQAEPSQSDAAAAFRRDYEMITEDYSNGKYVQAQEKAAKLKEKMASFAK